MRGSIIINIQTVDEFFFVYILHIIIIVIYVRIVVYKVIEEIVVRCTFKQIIDTFQSGVSQKLESQDMSTPRQRFSTF